MSTYRKFDKYRQRADFASEIFYGAPAPSNTLYSNGTGTPVFTPGANGIVVGTSAGGTATSFLRRGAVGSAAAANVLTLTAGKKAHVVALLSLDAGLPETGNIVFGLAATDADPLANARAVIVIDAVAGTVTATVGSETKTADLLLDEYVTEDGQLALEAYYDGTDHIQFFVGRKRVLSVPVSFAENGNVNGIAATFGPILGVANDGTAAVHTVTVHAFGYAAQRSSPYVN